MNFVKPAFNERTVVKKSGVYGSIVTEMPLGVLSLSAYLKKNTKIDFDEKSGKYYLLCDSPRCSGGHRMLPKEGDNLGIGPIRGRLDKDEEILRKAFALHGIPKILLRNHVSLAESKELFDDYEITPEYSFERKNGIIKTVEKPWSIKDDSGVESVSLLSAPVVIALLKQLAEILE